jgi:hypothetical protein
MYSIVLSIMLFSKEEWRWWFSFKNLQACGYHVPPPSVETGYPPYSFIICKRKRSEATNIFFALLIYQMNDFFIFWWFDNRDSKPYQFGTTFYISFIFLYTQIFINILFLLWWHFIWFVFLNSVPDINMAYLD